MQSSNENKSIMVVNSTEDENRVAIIKNNKIQEISVEQSSTEHIKGNIYKARVVQINDSIQAAFLDYGEKRHAFLALDEVNYNVFPSQSREKDRGSIRSRLRPGQHVMVQVIREATETKGAAVSTFIHLPGLYLVFTPDSTDGGVSKKIVDEEQRERLKSFIAGIIFESNSVIVRTAGIDRDLNDLKKDYMMLKKEWNSIQQAFEQREKPGLLYSEDDNIVKTIRDYYTDEIKEVWIDNPNPFQVVHSYFKKHIPNHLNRLRLYMGDMPIFSHFNIEQQIDELHETKVSLPSGGSIIIEQTEALVAIDVNSGRSKQESSSNSTALRTNLEAAAEVARQLRIRNLAGLIVVDFIDMDSADDCKQVEELMAECMKDEKASHNIGKISQFGLLELSRQRLSKGFAFSQEENCSYCKGRGKIPNLTTYSNNILRKIRTVASEGGIEQITVTVPNEASMHLLNAKRHELHSIEQEFDLFVGLKGSNDMTYSEQVIIKTKKRSQEKPLETFASEQSLQQQPSAKKEEHPAQRTESLKAKEERPVKQESREERPVKQESREEEGKPKFSGKPPTGRGRSEQSSAQKIKETESDTIINSCLFKDLKEYNPAEAMKELKRRMAGGCLDESKIFIDEKYLMPLPNFVASKVIDEATSALAKVVVKHEIEDVLENLEETSDIHEGNSENLSGREVVQLEKKAEAKTQEKSAKQTSARKEVKAPEKTEAKPASNASAKASTKPADKATAKPSEKAKSNLPTKAPAKPVTKSATKAPAQPLTKAPSKPAAKAPSKPAAKAPSKPAEKAPSKPVAKAPSKPAAKAPSKPAAKPAEKAPSKPVKK